MGDVLFQGDPFPMLPERLSTDITSLNENEDRVAVVAEMIVKPNGDVPESKFFRAVVRNQAKLSYEDVGDWFDNGGSMPEALGRDAELKQQIELQHVDHEEGGLNMLRVRIREGKRFTIFDIDPVTARAWGEALLQWVQAQPRE